MQLVVLSSVGVYGEATWIPTDNLRVLAGLRSDYYDFNVTAGKIYNNPELNDTLGDRLKGGR